ncbi:hypothetical protein [Pseudonocardia zijingensis]|uniref:hypothetical protein n=1 Tax=Pseudonocardia zijingensis TaxID=153376 RepID=UPI0031D001EE
MGTAVVERTGSRSWAEPAHIELAVTPFEARNLPYTIHGIMRSVRDQLSRMGGSADQVTIDLSAVPPLPACAPLLALFQHVQRAVGPRATIVVIGPSPALAACLRADLPEGVVLVDRTGRRWPG